MIIIEKAGVDTIPFIQDLIHITWPATYDAILPPGQSAYMLQQIYSTDSLQQQLQDGHQFIVARHNEQSVAFASYSPKNDSPGIYKLHKIYILPGQQGKGIGRMLIDYTILEMSPCTRLQLNVNRHNPALQFYKKLGFTIIETVDIAIGNGYFMNDYVMELSV